RHTRSKRDWISDVCSSDLLKLLLVFGPEILCISQIVFCHFLSRPYIVNQYYSNISLSKIQGKSAGAVPGTPQASGFTNRIWFFPRPVPTAVIRSLTFRASVFSTAGFTYSLLCPRKYVFPSISASSSRRISCFLPVMAFSNSVCRCSFSSRRRSLLRAFTASVSCPSMAAAFVPCRLEYLKICVS